MKEGKLTRFYFLEENPESKLTAMKQALISNWFNGSIEITKPIISCWEILYEHNKITVSKVTMYVSHSFAIGTELFMLRLRH